jgi:hypothetical protein
MIPSAAPSTSNYVRDTIQAAMDRADKRLTVAEAAKRPLSEAEAALVDEDMAEVKRLNAQIEPIEARTKNPLRFDPVAGMLDGRFAKLDAGK